jgi:small subunit ribosomal protein S1
MKYGIGSECVGVITRVLDRGVIIELGNEVEGFVATHELGIPDLARPADAFKEGDEIPLKVVEFDQTQRKIVLSVNDYFRGKDRGDLHDFIAKHPTTTGSQSAVAIEQVISEPDAGFEAAAENPDIDEETDG